MQLSDWISAATQNDITFIKNNVTQFKQSKDADGNTALMIAAGNQFCQIVDELILQEYGFKNNLGQTALMLASIRGCAHCVAALAPYEGGQITHQGKTALMMALFNGNAAVSRILVNYELHIVNGENSPDAFLDQALEKAKSDDLAKLKQEINQIKSNPMWPMIQVLGRRLDNVEILTYKSFQISRKLEQESKKRDIFDKPMSSNRGDSALPPLKPNSSAIVDTRVDSRNQPVTSKEAKQKIQSSVYSQNLTNQSSEQAPKMTKNQQQLEQNLIQIKQDVLKMQNKMSVIEKSVSSALPQTNQIEFLYGKQNETDQVVNELIKNIEDLRANLSQIIEYNANFGKTVMGMLQSVIKNQSSSKEVKEMQKEVEVAEKQMEEREEKAEKKGGPIEWAEGEESK